MGVVLAGGVYCNPAASEADRSTKEKQEQRVQFSRYNDKNPQPFHNGGGLVYLDKGQTVLYTVVAVNQLELVYHHTDMQHRLYCLVPRYPTTLLRF